MSQKITDKNMSFMSEIQSIEKVNPLFSRATIRAFYVQKNRNGSYISEEVAEKAIPSIYNVPIVGEYIEETDNFGGHGESVEFKDDQIIFKSSTVPYGVIPESAKVYWEDVTEDSGIVNRYLVVEGAYLWTGRYDQLNVLKDNKFGQSMEIEVQQGNFAVVDGSEVFKVDEFIFSAFCILGIDKDGEGKVEPCFEKSSITTYSLDKVGFKREFNQMVEELKFSLQQGGNTNMSQENETNEVEVKEEVVETTETETPETEENFDNAETVEEEVATEAEVEETVEVDSDNPEQSTEAPETYDEHSSAEVTEDVTESVELSDEQTETEEVEVVDYEAKFNEATTQLIDLQSTYSAIQKELEELQSYKRQREEADLKSKFEGKLSDEEFEAVFSESKEKSMDSIEDKLFALIGKKNFSVQQKKTNVNKVELDFHKDEAPQSPYGDIFED